MAPNYPDLPDSPKSNVKTATSKAPSSPLSRTDEVEIDDFDKYEVRRAANGTGIFSSLFTLSLVRHTPTQPAVVYVFLTFAFVVNIH